MVSRINSTLLSLALAGVLTLAAYSHVIFVGIVVLITQVVIAAAPRPADATGRSVSAPRFVATIVAGLVATIVTLYPHLLIGASNTSSGEVGSIDTGIFAALIPAVAAGVFVALFTQMLRKDGRKSLVLTTSYAVTLCSFAALAVGWIGATQGPGGAQVVAVCAISLTAALLVWLAPLDYHWLFIDRIYIAAAAVLAGGIAGGIAASFLGNDLNIGWLFGGVAGLGIGMFSILGQVLGRAWCSGRRRVSSGWGFPGAMSIVMVAPIVYVASQFVTFSL